LESLHLQYSSLHKIPKLGKSNLQLVDKQSLKSQTKNKQGIGAKEKQSTAIFSHQSEISQKSSGSNKERIYFCFNKRKLKKLIIFSSVKTKPNFGPQ
jgi:hypothetical protein